MAPPTIVVVPAACQTPVFYEPLARALQPMGFESAVVSMPSVGVSPGLKNFDEDVAAVRKVVDEVIENGTDVVVLMHSYGGIPGSAALKGLSKTSRLRAGKEGGVIRLIYVCSFCLKEGTTIPGANDIEGLKAMAGDWFDEKTMTLNISPQAAIMGQFHDLPSPAEGEYWAGLMKSHSVGALWSTQTYAAYKDIPSAYVICLLDRIVSVQKQEEMIREAREVQPKAFDVVERLQSGHQPILSLTPALADVVKKAVETESW